ncbi:MAG: hypothetical protein JWN61_2901 [Pseudonocardiales bacterium]|nr:hypothetical protein [Jatrophihabitantaceae bacterium]MCW2604766.1 hypothetical protein [Pseudonocardiales bacterium]
MPNPVLRGFGQTGAPRSQAPTPSPQQLQGWYNSPSYQGPQAPQLGPYAQPGSAQPGYGQPAGGYPPPAPPAGGGGYGGGFGPAAPTRYMTLDDVVVRTAMLLGTLLMVGAATWILTPDTGAWGLVIVALIAGLGLGLYISFTGKANAVTTLIYAGLQGVVLGAISRAFEQQWPGIVVQAITGTVMVAVGVLVVYKTGAIRVTPKFTRIVIAATFGLVGLMLVNLVAMLFTSDGLGLRSGGPLAIGFSLVCIVIAALNLVLDFDMIEQGIRHGADEKFAWYASFGILVTLVWLYLEILRLLGYLRSD